MKNRALTINPSIIVRCRLCSEPMYYIYDRSVRECCFECSIEIKAAEVELLSDNGR